MKIYGIELTEIEAAVNSLNFISVCCCVYDKKIIVVGLGKLAFYCVEYISNLYKINVELYDANDQPSTYLRRN